MKLPIQAPPIVRHNLTKTNKIINSGVQPQGWCFAQPDCPVNGPVVGQTDNPADCCNRYPNGSWTPYPEPGNCQNCPPPPVPPNSPASPNSSTSSTSSDFTFGQRTPRFRSR